MCLLKEKSNIKMKINLNINFMKDKYLIQKDEN